MKKLLIVLFAAAMLAGCSAQTNNSDGGSSQSSSSTSSAETSATSEEALWEEIKKRLLSDTGEFPQLEEPEEGEEIAVMTTSMGVIKLKLCSQEAPKAVENFVTHAKEGYYDGLIFHRVINDFMIQGGDPEGTGRGGESIWGEKFEDEFSPSMYHFRGAIAMANSGANTNGSQFYIVQRPQVYEGYFDQVDQIKEKYGADELLTNQNTGKLLRTNYSEEAKKHYEQLGGTPDLDYGYTIFGQVIEGMDVVDAIAKTKTDETDKPVEDIILEKVEIVPYTK